MSRRNYEAVLALQSLEMDNINPFLNFHPPITSFLIYKTRLGVWLCDTAHVLHVQSPSVLNTIKYLKSQSPCLFWYEIWLVKINVIPQGKCSKHYDLGNSVYFTKYDPHWTSTKLFKNCKEAIMYKSIVYRLHMLPYIYIHTHIYLCTYSVYILGCQNEMHQRSSYSELLLSENTSGHLFLLRGWRTGSKELLAIHYFNAFTILKQSQESIASLLIPISRFD